MRIIHTIATQSLGYCDSSDAARYASDVHATLAAAFPEATIEVRTTDFISSTQTEVRGCEDESTTHELVEEIANRVWSKFC